ncbi:hypothetical protein ACFTXK_31895, partial [Streptomyces sp. NPDC056956]|uniref:hypothetical protein n=1 Tax=Streptomyces sp. NPDC056956 TaxID=3345980 RepID=UPI003637D6A3
DLDRLWGAFKQLYPVKVTVEELEEEAGDRAGGNGLPAGRPVRAYRLRTHSRSRRGRAPEGVARARLRGW